MPIKTNKRISSTQTTSLDQSFHQRVQTRRIRITYFKSRRAWGHSKSIIKWCLIKRRNQHDNQSCSQRLRNYCMIILHKKLRYRWLILNRKEWNINYHNQVILGEITNQDLLLISQWVHSIRGRYSLELIAPRDCKQRSKIYTTRAIQASTC